MTVPFLMNCPHLEDAWCLTCTAELGNNLWKTQAERDEALLRLSDSKWVAVTERLPSGGERIIAVNSAGYTACVDYLNDCRATGDGFVGIDEMPEKTEAPLSDVTHWKPLGPLPEAPK